MSDDNFTQFAEEFNDNVSYELNAFDSKSGIVIAHIGALSLESLQEQFHKLEAGIDRAINKAYNELPEADLDDDEELGNNAEPIQGHPDDYPNDDYPETR